MKKLIVGGIVAIINLLLDLAVLYVVANWIPFTPLATVVGIVVVTTILGVTVYIAERIFKL